MKITIEQVVEILNRFKWRARDDWQYSASGSFFVWFRDQTGVMESGIEIGGTYDGIRTPEEAMYIARSLLRDEACEPFVKVAISIPTAATRISISAWGETGRWMGDLATQHAIETPAAWERLAELYKEN
jgi:hypothetical protein